MKSTWKQVAQSILFVIFCFGVAAWSRDYLMSVDRAQAQAKADEVREGLKEERTADQGWGNDISGYVVIVDRH